MQPATVAIGWRRVRFMSNTQHDFIKARPDLVTTVHELCQLPSWHNVLFILLDYGIIAGSIAISVYLQNVLVYILAVCVIGSRMRALENLVHEAVHDLLFENLRLNDFVGLIFCACPIGSSLYACKRTHYAHHAYLGDPKLDPELRRLCNLGLSAQPCSRWQLFKRFLAMICIVDTLVFFANTCKSHIHRTGAPRRESQLRWLFYVIMGGTIVGLDIGMYFLLYWVVPFFTSFQIIRFFAEISEHYGLYQESADVLKTRNNLIHPFFRFFFYPHSACFHLTHHIFPEVPHYNLWICHRILMGWEAYAKAHHCYHFFHSLDVKLPSTLREMTAERKKKKQPSY